MITEIIIIKKIGLEFSPATAIKPEYLYDVETLVLKKKMGADHIHKKETNNLRSNK